MLEKLKTSISTILKSGDRSERYGIFEFNLVTKEFGFTCESMHSKDDPIVLCWIEPDGKITRHSAITEEQSECLDQAIEYFSTSEQV